MKTGSPAPLEGSPYLGPLTEHDGAIFSLACSPDGRWMASGDFLGIIRLWDIRSTKASSLVLRQRSNDSTRSVSALVFADKGRTLVSGDNNGRLYWWDALSGKLLGESKTHRDGITALVACGSDGSRVASGSHDGSIRFWNPQKREAVESPLAPLGPLGLPMVLGLASSLDGRLLAAGYDAGSVRLWDTITGHLIKGWELGDPRVNDVAFSPDGERLAIATHDNTVRILEAATGRQAELFRTNMQPWHLAYAPSGRELAVGMQGAESGPALGGVRVWDLENLRTDGRPLEGASRINALVYEPQENLIIAAGEYSIHRWHGERQGPSLAKAVSVDF